MSPGETRKTVLTGLGRPIHVELVEGVFRDKVRAWQDVRPALGGSLGYRTCWHKGDRGMRLYELVIAGYIAFTRNEPPPPIPKPFR